MTKRIKFSLIWVLAGLLMSIASGCAHSVHQYHVSGATPSKSNHQSSRVIYAESEQFVVLSFAFNTDYADDAYQKLLANCPQGEIVGVNARYSTSMSFLSYTNKMRLEALCLE